MTYLCLNKRGNNMLVVDKNTFKTEVLENEGYVLVDFFWH